MSLLPKVFPKIFTAAALATTLVMGASGAMAGPYSATWNSGVSAQTREINPIMKIRTGSSFYTAPQYYSYNTPFGASVNTPDQIERSQVASFFLFDDGNELSMFTFFDVPRDPDGGNVNATITSTGLAGNNGVYVSVRDDPGDSSYAWNVANGTSNPDWRWSACCTDGMVLSGLPNGVGDEWSLNFAFNDYSGVTEFRVYLLNDAYEDGGRTIQSFNIPAAQANSLVISRTSEVTVVAISEPAAALFPLAALFLIGGIARNRRRARS